MVWVEIITFSVRKGLPSVSLYSITGNKNEYLLVSGVSVQSSLHFFSFVQVKSNHNLLDQTLYVFTQLESVSRVLYFITSCRVEDSYYFCGIGTKPLRGS